MKREKNSRQKGTVKRTYIKIGREAGRYMEADRQA